MYNFSYRPKETKGHQPHKKRKIILIISAVLCVLLAGAAVAYFLFIQKPKATPQKAPSNQTAKKVTPAVKYYSPLTGLEVSSKAAETATVTGVMIENSPDARPQSGIKNSGVVFEAIAEGGITRFLVLYQQEKPKLIGPVRSVRVYYIDWASGFNASIAHIGGSDAALSEIRSGSYRDLDDFLYPNYYWRSTDRYAPHNVYTSFDNLDALNQAQGYTSSNFTGFTRTDAKPSSAPNATQISVTISGPLYNSSYAYDKATNTYIRSQNGEAHVDREDGQIAPNVVVIMYVDETTIWDGSYHQQITTIGSGKAVIFQNGTAAEVTWSKSSQTDQIKFTDSSGKDVPLVRGQTWITAVPNDGGGVTWQ